MAVTDERRRAFQRVKPLCGPLLQLGRQPKQALALLQELRAVLADESPHGLQAVAEYLLLPLRGILEATHRSRKGALTLSEAQQNSPESNPSCSITRPTSSEERPDSLRRMRLSVPGDADMVFPAAKVDRIAEANLECLLTLLQRVLLDMGSARVLVYHLCCLLALPRSSASEEVGLGRLTIEGSAIVVFKDCQCMQFALLAEGCNVWDISEGSAAHALSCCCGQSDKPLLSFISTTIHGRQPLSLHATERGELTCMP